MISLLVLQHYAPIGNVPTHFDLSLVNETGSGNLKILFNTIFVDVVGCMIFTDMGDCLSNNNLSQIPIITSLTVTPNPSVHGDIVVLKVHVSNEEVSSFRYLWSEHGPLIVPLSGADRASPSFIAPRLMVDTNITFSVTVTDEIGRASSMNITASIKNSTYEAPEISLVEFQDGSHAMKLHSN
jgi:hypothetical protein